MADTDAYSAYAPTYAYRFDHTPVILPALGLGAVHGSEIVHIFHSYDSHLGRRLNPLGRWLTPAGSADAKDLAGLRPRGRIR